MNEYQQRKYEREVMKMSSPQLQHRMKKINQQIVDCFANNKKKMLKNKKQEKKIIENIR